MAKQASHSWLTWAPESASPRSTSSLGNRSAIASRLSLASTEENREVRSSASDRSSSTSSGVTPCSRARSTTERPTRSGRVDDSATESEALLNRLNRPEVS